MADREIKVKLSVDGKEYEASLGKAEKATEGFGSRIKGLAKEYGAFLSAAALGAFFKASIEEAAKAEVGMGRLGVAVRNAGGDFGQLRPQLEQTVSSVMRLSTATDDDLREALTKMIAVSGDVAGSQKNLSLVTDLAAFKQIDLASASEIVAKAMGGNTTALNKMGIAGKDATTVLDNARAAFGGFAEQESQTFSGSLTRINNQWGEFQEAVGTAILSGGEMGGVADGLAGVLAKLAGWIEANEGGFRLVTGAVADAAGALFAVGKTVYDVVQPALGPVFKVTLGILIGALNTASFVVKQFAASMQFMSGVSLDALGWLVEKGGALLKLFGVQVVSEAGTSMRAFGAQLRTAALADSKAAGATYAQSMKDLVAGRVETHKKLEQEEVAHGVRIKTETDTQRKARVAAEEEAQAKLADVYAKYNRLILEANDKLQQGLKKTGGSWEDIRRKVDEAHGALLKMPPTTGNLASAAAHAADENARMKREITEAKQALDAGVDSAASIGISIVSAANGMGAMSSEAATTLTSLINMGAAISKFGIGSPEGVIAIVGSLAQLIGGWASSPAEMARRDMNLKNIEALRQNTVELGNFNLGSSGKTFTGTKEALDIARQAGLDAAKANPRGGVQAIADATRKTLIEELLKRGVSLKDAFDLLDQIGVQGLDSKDPLSFLNAVQGGIENLGEIEFGQFNPNSFEDQLKALTAGFDILGTADADEKLNEFRDLVGKFSPALAKALNVDLSTPEGRAQATKNLQDLFGKLNAGGLSATEIGVSGNQFLSLIQTILPLLGEANGLTAGGTALGGGTTSGVVGSIPATASTVGVGAGVPTPRVADAFAGAGAASGGTTINGGVNVAINLPNITDSREAAEAIADYVSDILGRSYAAQRAALGLGT